MGTQSVGIREFRENLATYLLESDGPVAITRHGDTIGYFLPTRRKPTAEQIEAIRQTEEKIQVMMTAAGVTEDEVIEEFQRIRAEERRKGIKQ
jgi:antitoxin (DNA-binding transcriptional repressor) of toxin-antitoxin stability system